ncbi:PREDICTED: lysosome-associated membrane glycoprotein 3 isoform X2 [Chinchilla lanigera]|uniref:Lysosome-associated membrane glycoprotein 3 n=1 Tax=Chinchilla lanigera TaxID=34839 RepID=A0A8C2W078_CHILA|nr:PREDICTED: lysosome-associated membrane glycoprotein 3 isoform X2 [Chinchilla lanigera]
MRAVWTTQGAQPSTGYRAGPVSRPPHSLVMSHLLSAAAALLLSLAVILHDGHPVRVKALAEARDGLRPPAAGTGPATAKPRLQPTKHVPDGPSATRSRGAHTTSQTAGETSENPAHTTRAPTTTSQTAKSTPPSSPVTHAPATPNNTGAPLTEATIRPASAPHSQPPVSPTSAPRTSPSTVSLATGKTTQPGEQATVSKTWSTAPYKSTTGQKPSPSTHTPETSIATHNATPTASPATTVPGATLAPEPSSAKTGIYQVLNGSRLCIKAEMGLQLIVQEVKSVFSPQRYFNIDPNTTKASGHCGFRKSNLLLSFPGGSVNITFTQEENSYYISEIGAYLTVSNPEKVFQGLKSGMVMFQTVLGHSFQCVSEQSAALSSQLQLKTTNVQLQAFDFEDDRFGNVDECSSDYAVVLPVIGAVVLALCFLGLCVCVTRLRRRSAAYQRI